MKKRILFWIGISILIIVAVSYFVKINVEQGSNYVVKSPLLRVLIFHNPFILGLYIMIALVLIIRGIKK